MAQRDLARFVGARRGADIALLPNATAGLNSVISSEIAQLGPSDAVLFLDLNYGSVKTTIRVACAGSGAAPVELKAPLKQICPDEVAYGGGHDDWRGELVGLVEETLRAQPNIRFAVFDHVASNTALTLPVAALARVCRDRSVTMLVDGAHGPLTQRLDLDDESISPDYYVGNLHKWVCCRRGAAFVHIADHDADEKQNNATKARIDPVVVSHGWNAPSFSERFVWDGCRDYTAALTIPVALAFWRRVGVHATRDHLAHKARRAAQVLERELGPYFDEHELRSGLILGGGEGWQRRTHFLFPRAIPGAADPGTWDRNGDIVFN